MPCSGSGVLKSVPSKSKICRVVTGAPQSEEEDHVDISVEEDIAVVVVVEVDDVEEDEGLDAGETEARRGGDDVVKAASSSEDEYTTRGPPPWDVMHAPTRPLTRHSGS